MSNIKCGTCTACCEWGDDKSIRPTLLSSEKPNFLIVFINGVPKLESDINGNCVYLLKQGCSIYSRRPAQCRKFDCRTLYNQMKGKTFVKVLFMGKEKS